MPKTTAILVGLVACLVLLLGQPPAAAGAAPPHAGEEPPDARHSGLDLRERAPGAAAPEAAADTLTPTALAAWTTVVFQSYRDGNWEIYRADGDGNNQERMTVHGAADVQPRLNRGNTQIVFASNRTGNYEIYRMNANGAGVTQLTHEGANDVNPSWSPDGSRIAFQSFRDGNWEVYAMNADGSGLTRLTTDGDYDAEAVWSPDGTRLAFVSRRTGGFRVYVMNSNGTGQTQLSAQAYSSQPAWSPDGSQIAYSNDSNGDGWYDFWLMNADGSGQGLVVAGSGGDQTDVITRSWSPDGRYVAFTRVYWVQIENQYYWIYAYPEYRDQTNGTITRLSNQGEDWEPDWQTADVTPPATRATALTAWTLGGTVTVNWGGTDVGQAGLRSYDVQYRIGPGGGWVDWLANTTSTSANYNGAVGNLYSFRVRARDNAFNQEAYPGVADAATTTYSYSLAGNVLGNRGQPIAAAGVAPAPGALTSAFSGAAGQYNLYFTQTGPYTLTVTRSGFDSLPGLRNAPLNGTGVNFYLPPADDRLVNGGLETGSLGPWTTTGELPAVVTNRAHTGQYGVQLGDEQLPPTPADPTSTSTPQFVLKWGSQGTTPGLTGITEGITTNADGSIVYVTDPSNNRIQKFDQNGNFLMAWGTAGSGNGQFNLPYLIAVDAAGNVYVSDHLNHRIQKFDSNGNYLSQWGSLGSADGQFSHPYGIAFDSVGNIYISDVNNHRIQKFDSNGVFLAKWGSLGAGNNNLHTPNGIAIDSADNVYVADVDNYRIVKYDSAGNFITKWGSQGSGNNQFGYPVALAVDAYDNVYLGDANNHRIQKFTSTGTFMVSWGSYGTGNGLFMRPRGVYVDNLGNVYVADTDNYRWQKFAQPWLPATPGLTPFSGSGPIAPTGGVVAAGPVTVTVPPGAVVASSTFTIASSFGTPALPAGLRMAGLPFTVSAVISSVTPLTQTGAAITVTVRYSETTWQSSNIGAEGSLQLWQYDTVAAAWQPLTGTLDTLNNRVVATTTQLGLLALLGTEHVGTWVTAVEQVVNLGGLLTPSATLSLLYNVSAVNAVSDSVRLQLIGASQTYTYTLTGATLAAGSGSWKHAWWAVPGWANATMTVRLELFVADRSVPTIVTFDEISLGDAAPGGHILRLPAIFNIWP